MKAIDDVSGGNIGFFLKVNFSSSPSICYLSSNHQKFLYKLMYSDFFTTKLSFLEALRTNKPEKKGMKSLPYFFEKGDTES